MKKSLISQLLLSVALVSTVPACTDAQINQVAQALSQARNQATAGKQPQANPNQQQNQGPLVGQGQAPGQGHADRSQQAFGQGQPQGQAPTGQMGAPRGDGAMQPPPPPPPAGPFGYTGGNPSPMTGDQPPQGPQPRDSQQQAALPPALP